MPTVESISLSQSTKLGAAGTGKVTFQNTATGHIWHVRLVTASALNLGVTVAKNGVQIIDSTANDPRPTATSDSKYDLGQGDSVIVSWTAGTNGQVVTATLTYDDEWR